MKRLDLIFLWHMHQPDYRDHASGEFMLPWTYLHALKDYSDMAAHLERHPQVRAVVNFVPVLLDQLDDYVAQFASGKFRDPLLRWLAMPDLEILTFDERSQLLNSCFRCHHATMLDPFPSYRRLKQIHAALVREGEKTLTYLSSTYLADLLVWYHLAWTGETERRREPLLAELIAKGEGFSLQDRQRLLAYIGRALAAVVPRYRALQERGQIEISVTPATHPLSPLLIDFHAARESLPDASLPLAAAYPGGRERVRRQIVAAQQSHTVRFGTPPLGMWPAEGGVSERFVELAAMSGCRWLASGEAVLKHSLTASGVVDTAGAHHHPWRLKGVPDTTLFFRDDRLSDLIGFEYARWHGHDAAAHFVGELERIAATAAEDDQLLLCIALDGENAWEYYPYNAYYFFEELYGLLEGHPMIRTSTCADIVAANAHTVRTLEHLTAGSWVYGTFSTWIGDPAKNHAWELLCAAKQSYDEVIASGRLSFEEASAAEAQLAVCESSDWFWWFGDENPAPVVAEFDRLFRRNLANLYRCLHLAPPASLEKPISLGRALGGEDGVSVTMRRAG